jgi:hypothetical protein
VNGLQTLRAENLVHHEQIDVKTRCRLPGAPQWRQGNVETADRKGAAGFDRGDQPAVHAGVPRAGQPRGRRFRYSAVDG